MPSWNSILDEITTKQRELTERDGEQAGARALNQIRKKYLKELQKITKRNTVAFYSAFPSKKDKDFGISPHDINGFKACVKGLDCKNGLDLVLHTPKGDHEGTISIIKYLNQQFGTNVRVLIPHMAMSGGTLIALSGKEILMTKHSCIGPVDPQLNNISATLLVQELKRVRKEMKEDSEVAKGLWYPILSQITPDFVESCIEAIEHSKQQLQTLLERNMLCNDLGSVEKVVRHLTEQRTTRTHNRQIPYEEARKIGLNVTLVEDDQKLQDALLSVHHTFTYTVDNTPMYKIIESDQDGDWAKI